MKKYAIIVAAGSGSRMGSPIPKQFMLLAGKPVLWHTVRTFLHSYEDMNIILVLPKGHMSQSKDIVPEGGHERIQLAPGGETRFHSVKNGLQYVSSPSIIFVHDGVRCLLSSALIHRCYQEAVAKGNAIPSITSSDSIRLELPEGSESIDRNKVRIIQTPQVFRSELILPAFQQEYDTAFTDEASVVETTGIKIHLIEGEHHNIKITRPIDILIAERIMTERAAL